MYYLLSLIAHLCLLYIFGLNELFTSGSVLVPHDTFYPINDYLATTAFATFNSAFNYSNNLAGLMVLAPDALAIHVIKLFFNNHTSQILHIALCVVTFHTLSFFSFYRIFNRSKLTAALTLCYCFSPYSSILYSAGIIYQLSTVIGLGLLPLFLFKLMNFDPKKDTFLLILLTLLLAFGLLFIYPALLLIILAVFLLWNKQNYLSVKDIIYTFDTKRVIALLVLSLPFCFFIYLTLVAGNDKTAFLSNGTSSAIKGGIFYPLMQISAWGLYNVWSPRAILSFHQYFFENPYRILSLSLPFLLIYFLYKNKKFTPIIFLLFLAFFAKGANPPLGDIFTVIINYFPFGYMIRSPDSKFGAFIAAWFVVAILYLTPKQKSIIVSLSCLFLITNLAGMFYNGAISSARGDQNTTSFISDPEADQISRLIQSHSNVIVIGNFTPCAEEWYEGKFHTCHGLLSTSLSKQIIQAKENKLIEAIEQYTQFPTLVLVNKRQKDKRYLDESILSNRFFTPIYSSENFELYFKNTKNTLCELQFDFSCIHYKDSVLVSIPEAAFKYYYSTLDYTMNNGLVTLKAEPSIMQDLRRSLFLWVYALVYFLSLLLVFNSEFFTRQK
jgi:hypothetical protein